MWRKPRRFPAGPAAIALRRNNDRLDTAGGGGVASAHKNDDGVDDMQSVAMAVNTASGRSASRFFFSSRLPAEQRVALEQLLFFNVHQSRVRGALREVIERWGCPEVLEEDGFLRVALAGRAGVQCLFVSQPRAGSLQPLGVALYLRDAADLIAVLHLSLAPAYAAGGLHAEANLLGRLLREVKGVARRTSGIRHVLVAYRALRGPAAASHGVVLAS